MEGFSAAAAAIIAALALAVSYLSWRASVQAVAASTFDRRYEIYADAERFISAWMRDARPDLSLLSVLVGAWSRSHFLCSKEVTTYLRKVWLDSIRASQLERVMAGAEKGDHGRAVEEFHDLLREHADFDRLRAKFMHDLKIATPRHIFERA